MNANPLPVAIERDRDVANWARRLQAFPFPTSVTSTYTAKTTDTHILVDSTGGAVTVNLPDAAQAHAKGQSLYIKRVAGGSNVTLDPFSTQTIDGASTVVLSAINQWRWIYSDGSNWQVLAEPAPTSFEDLTITDDLTVNDDATVTGDLSAGTLTVGGSLARIATQSIELTKFGGSTENNNVAVNAATGLLVVTAPVAGAQDDVVITGFAGGAADRLLRVTSVDTDEIDQIHFQHQDTSSTDVNRLILPGAVTLSLTVPFIQDFLYRGGSTNRWYVV